MNDLEAIARGLHLPVESLKRPADLLNQGYDPSFLATYRPDELGQLDVKTLAKVKRSLDYQKRVSAYRAKLKEQATSEGWWVDSLQKLIDNAESVAEIDGLTRNIRSRKSSRILAERDPKLAKLGQAILTMNGSAPEDLLSWVVAETGVTAEQAEQTLLQTKNWLAVLLSEDAQLLHQLGRQILRRGQVSMKMLAEPSEKEQALKDAAEANGNTDEGSLAEYASEPVSDMAVEVAVDAANAEQESVDATAGIVDATQAPSSVDMDSSVEETDHTTDVVSDVALEAEAVTSEEETNAETTTASTESLSPSDASASEPAPVDPLLAAFPSAPAPKTRTPRGKGAKNASAPASKGPVKPLTPRQRRRKWLRSILQRYSKLRKPLTRLGHYEALMLGRGQRSQIIAMRIEYDLSYMTKLAHDALCSNGHPMESFLSEVADNSLTKIILPRLEHDVFSELEEAAHHELTELAVRHLQEMIDQRPVRGHRILLIDAMGPKSAAVAIVDPRGHVDFTGELSSVSSRSDVVTQNVATLGEWIHTYKVSLVAISNGNTRRYLIQTVAELMKQSGEGGDLRWTIVDRTGADAYCETRQALQELPTISRRHRAAVWLAWRLQDPLIEITKVDPARLRLGSYQRELPQDTLEKGLEDAVSSSVAARGVDVWHSHEKSLVCLPGIDLPMARAIVDLRDRADITTREKLVEALKSSFNETQIRQAIGYLRVFESSQTLDGTMVHPDDYRLAERLIATGELTQPAAAPENWTKPVRADATAPTASSDVSSDVAANDSAAAEETKVDEAEAVEGVVVENLDFQDDVTTLSTSGDAMEEAALEVAAEEASEEASEAARADSQSETVASDADQTGSDIPSFSQPKSTSAATEDATAGVSEKKSKPAPVIVLAPTNPENPEGPSAQPPLTIDVEKLSRSWQVGREKTRFVSRCLQQPFADSRDMRAPIPLLTSMPTMETLRQGQTLWGIVIGVADFGAFMDLGPDCNGLVHVSRLSREFVEDPQEVVQIGDLIQVWVMHVDLDKRRIALSALPPGVEQARRPGSFDPARNEGGRDGGGRDGRRDGRRDGQGQGREGYSQAGRNPAGSGSNAGGNNRGGARPGPGGAQPAGTYAARQQSSNQSSGPAGASNPSGQRPGGFAGNRGGGQSGGQGGGQGRGNQGRGGQGGGRDGYGRGGSSRDRSDSRNDINEFNKKQSKPAKPAPPISDAMKEGKEPMRSFSDLIQFMQPKRNDPLPSSPTTQASTSADQDVALPVVPGAVENALNKEAKPESHAPSVQTNEGQASAEPVQQAAKQISDSTSDERKIASESVE